MKFYKLIFISVVFIFFQTLSQSIIFAAATNITTDYTSQSSDINEEYPLPCDNELLCSQITTDTCWNGENVGVSTSCTPACEVHPDGRPWTKYVFTRDPDVDCRLKNATTCVAVFHSDGARTCSTGDKYNSSNPPVLNAGSCTCEPLGPYKTCCSGTTPVSANSFEDDPYDPLEGGCGGATVVRCGGSGPACGQAACNTLATPTPTPTPTPTSTPTPTPATICNGGIAVSCSSPTCPSGYTAIKLVNGNWVCMNNSTGNPDCSATPTCNPTPTPQCFPGQTRTRCDLTVCAVP